VEAQAEGKRPIGLVDGQELVGLLIEQGIGVKARSVKLMKIEAAELLDHNIGEGQTSNVLGAQE
jgi:restriction endonuclease Mrr